MPTAPQATVPYEDYRTPDVAGRIPAADGRQPYWGWSPVGEAQFDAGAYRGDKRLRQWDFFTVMNDQVALNVTLADFGLATMCTVDAIEWSSGRTWQAAAFSLGAITPIGFGSSPRQDVTCTMGSSRVIWHAPNQDEHAIELEIDIAGTLFTSSAKGHLKLTRPAGAPYLSHIMPLDDRGAFFYQNKIPGYDVEGTVKLGKTTMRFATGSHAIRDWGRGLWPAQLTWLWGAGHGQTADGRKVWANFGGGFGDSSRASENLLVIDGQAYKLGQLTWTMDADGVPEALREADGLLELRMDSRFVQKPQLNIVVKSMRLRKSYGTWHGYYRPAPGAEPVELTLEGFGEEMRLKW